MVASITKIKAQMPHDAIYMPKGNVCVALIGSQSQWTEYWEGSLKRENLNIGTHTTQSAAIMVAAGISKNLNLIVNLPYIRTEASAGNLMGQKGIQDLSGWLKYKMLEKGGISLHAVAGGSIPVGNYSPDFLPMSIGMNSKSLTGRIIGNYQFKSGIYLQGHASYSYRSASTIDADVYYFNGKLINGQNTPVPNTTDLRAAIGYYRGGKQIEVFSEKFGCISGDDIRRNNMPFPTNNMQSNMVGAYGKFQPKNLGINARVGFCYKGLNVGNSTSYSLGILYNIVPKVSAIKAN